MDILSASVSMFHIHIVPAEVSDHMDWSYRQLGAVMLMLGIKPMSSVRVASAPARHNMKFIMKYISCGSCGMKNRK